LGAYVVWLMCGLLPIAGQSVYLILPPSFSDIQFTETGSRIVVHDFDPVANPFVTNITVNGQPVIPPTLAHQIMADNFGQWTKNWISHAFFSEGMTMEITVGPVPGEWGTRDEDVPPSLSTGGFAFDDEI
jgi:putative alpha-1,2-mannosidase